MLTIYYILITVYVALQLADYCTTVYATERGALEVNPLLAYGFTRVPRRLVLALSKSVALLPLCILSPSWPLTVVLSLLCLLYACALANNYWVIRSIK